MLLDASKRYPIYTRAMKKCAVDRRANSALMESLSRARKPHAICRRDTVDPVGHLGKVN